MIQPTIRTESEIVSLLGEHFAANPMATVSTASTYYVHWCPNLNGNQPEQTVLVVSTHPGKQMPGERKYPTWEFQNQPSIAWREALDFCAQRTASEVAADMDENYFDDCAATVPQ